MSQTEFNSHISQWVTLDTQTKQLTEKLKEVRDKKSVLNTKIIDFANQHQLINSSFQIPGGKIKFGTTNVQQQISLGYLQKCLGDIIKNETQRTQIYDYIKNNRESKTINEIKRFPNI